VFLAMQPNRSSRVKLVDFGVAGFLDALRGAREREGFLVGTPRYASPEQQRGERATTQMDVWSLGVVVFEMIAGATPFRGRSLVESFAEVQSSEPAPRLSCLGHGTAERLSALVAAMLEKDPANRAPNMSDVRMALEALQEDRSLSSLRHVEASVILSATEPAAPGANRTLTAPGEGWAPTPGPNRGSMP
jgi:serine/threonine-protein kinase